MAFDDPHVHDHGGPRRRDFGRYRPTVPMRRGFRGQGLKCPRPLRKHKRTRTHVALTNKKRYARNDINRNIAIFEKGADSDVRKKNSVEERLSACPKNGRKRDTDCVNVTGARQSWRVERRRGKRRSWASGERATDWFRFAVSRVYREVRGSRNTRYQGGIKRLTSATTSNHGRTTFATFLDGRV